MAFAFVSRTLQGTNKTASTGVGFTYNAALPIGRLVILFYVTDNTGTTNGEYAANEHTAVTCGVGNIYTKITEYSFGNGSAGSGVTYSIWYSVLTVATATGTSLTLSFNGTVTAKACFVTNFTFDTTKTIAVAGFERLGSLNTTAPLLTCPGISSPCLLLRTCGIESTSVTPTVDSGWTSIGNIGTTGGSANTNVAHFAEYVVLNSTTDATNQPSYGTADRVDIALTLYEKSPRSRYRAIS